MHGWGYAFDILNENSQLRVLIQRPIETNKMREH